MPLHKIFAAVAALVGWASVALQLFLFLDNRTAPPVTALLRFFTYFTILSNLLAAIMFTVLAVYRYDHLLSSPGGITAVTAYMIVVGIIYNVFLRGLVNLDDLDALVN